MFLADACALLAFFGATGSTMTPAGMDAMRGDVMVSPITIWELTRKAGLGKLPPLPTSRGSFALHLAALGFQGAPLLWADAEAANTLPPHHRDPMDRMLIATALRAELTCVTSDRIFSTYGVKIIW